MLDGATARNVAVVGAPGKDALPERLAGPRAKALGPAPVPQSPRTAAFGLRALIRHLALTGRERACGLFPVTHRDDDPEIVLKTDDEGQRRARWCGVLMCGHIWTCPVCSAGLRAERAERIGLAVQHLGGRYQILTLTVSHHQGEPLDEFLDGFMSALRRVKQGGSIQRIWADAVTGSVRTVEMPYGDNGWHVHAHMVLRTREWTDEEKDTLVERWKSAVIRELGESFAPSAVRGVHWSEPFDGDDAAFRSLYVAKLGLEIVGVGKVGKRGSLTPWGIAQLAAQGDATAIRLWKEYGEATRGRRMIELDDRMAQAAKHAKHERALEILQAKGGEAPRYHDCNCSVRSGMAPVAGFLVPVTYEGPHALDCESHELLTPREPQRIPVTRDELRDLRRLERMGKPWLFSAVLTSAEQQGAAGVHAWAAYAHAIFAERDARLAEVEAKRIAARRTPVLRWAG